MVDTVGPVIFDRGMNVSTPPTQLPDQVSEHLFNFFYDRRANPETRPGSVFQARVGEGRILGMHEHVFSTTARERKVVVAVADAYSEVNTLRDPSNDGTASGGNGLAIDALAHGTPIITIAGGFESQYTFASLLDRLYIAGTTPASRVRFYDYGSNAYEPIDDVRGEVCVAYRQRLYVAGDPARPNLLYPSDFADPETFNTNLAIQIGSTNDPIRALVVASGMIVVLAEFSSHFFFGFDIEQGGLETDTIDPTVGCVGPHAADQAHGAVYWIDRNRGPVRFSRGGGGVDSEFSLPMLRAFQTVANEHLEKSICRHDPKRQCVHFGIPAGDSDVPSYFMSYWYQIGGWTHWATNPDLDAVRSLSPHLEFLDQPVGDPFYTELREWDSQGARGGTKYIAGDGDGILWKLTEDSPDRIREDSSGDAVKCFWRSAPLELAPVGRRALIHRAMLDLMSRESFDLKLYNERDYSGRFTLVSDYRFDGAGGDLDSDLVLDDPENARLGTERVRASHLRIPFWKDGLAKVNRLELIADRRIAMKGIEFERSIVAEGAAPLDHTIEPIPGGTVETSEEELVAESGEEDEGGEEPGTPVDPGGTTAPPDISAAFGALPNIGSWDHGEMWDVRDPDALALYGAYGSGTIPDSNGSQHAFITEDEQWVFVAGYGHALIYIFDVSDPTAPVHSHTIDIESDLGITGSTGHGIHGLHYYTGDGQFVTQVILAGGSAEFQGMCLYDISSPAAPALLASDDQSAEYQNLGVGDAAHFVAGITTGGRKIGLGIAGDSDALTQPTLLVWEVLAGPSIALIQEYQSVSNLGDWPSRSDHYRLWFSGTRDLLFVIKKNSTGERPLFSVIDVSNPSALVGRGTLVHSSMQNASGSGHNPGGIIGQADGETVYFVMGKHDDVDTAGVWTIDTSDPDALAHVDDQELLPAGNNVTRTQQVTIWPDDSKLLVCNDHILVYDLDPTTGAPTLRSQTVTTAETIATAFGAGAEYNESTFPRLSNILAVGVGEHLAIFDITTEDDPALLSFLERPDLETLVMGPDGDFIIVIDRLAGELRSIGFSSSDARKIEVKATLVDSRLRHHVGTELVTNDDRTKAWLTNVDGKIVEITLNETSPAVAAVSSSSGFGPVHGLVDTYLILAAGDSVRVVDTSTLAEVGSVSFPEESGLTGATRLGFSRQTIAVLNPTTVVVASSGEWSPGSSGPQGPTKIHVIDVSTPATPSITGSADLSADGSWTFTPIRMVDSDDDVFIARGPSVSISGTVPASTVQASSLEVWDLSAPATPAKTTDLSIEPPSAPLNDPVRFYQLSFRRDDDSGVDYLFATAVSWKRESSGSFRLVPDYPHHLVTIDVTNRAAPTVLDEYQIRTPYLFGSFWGLDQYTP